MKSTIRINIYTFTPYKNALIEINTHNHQLLYIYKYKNTYHKKAYIETPEIFYYDAHKIIKNFFFLNI